MSQSHSIPTDTHPCAITNTTFARNRHNALGELGFGINTSERGVVNNEKDKLLPAVKS